MRIASLGADEALSSLKSSAAGLSAAEAKRRLAEFGPNHIEEVGRENLQDLIDLRVADRLGSGTPKAMPYKLRHLQYMFKKVQNDPVSVKMLKINGDDLIKILKIKPGPKIGAILDVLLSEVLEDAELNTKEYLEKRSKELNKLELNELRGKAKIVIEEKREQDDKKIKEEFWVK